MLKEIYNNLPKESSVKWNHYFDIYETHFKEFKDKPINIMEIGVDGGGSLKMWKQYFPNAKVYGIDTCSGCKNHEEDRIKIFIGDQADLNFLQTIVKEVGLFDIIIDDGGHYPHQQIASLNFLFPNISLGGVYLIEDLHASYFPTYDGGYRRKGTGIEYLKGLVDGLNWWAFDKNEVFFCYDEFSRWLESITFYDSVAVLKKAVKQHVNPKPVKVGEAL